MGEQPSGTPLPAPSRARLPNSEPSLSPLGLAPSPGRGRSAEAPSAGHLGSHLQARPGGVGDGGRRTPSCPGDWSGVSDAGPPLARRPPRCSRGAGLSGDDPLSGRGRRWRAGVGGAGGGAGRAGGTHRVRRRVSNSSSSSAARRPKTTAQDMAGPATRQRLRSAGGGRAGLGATGAQPRSRPRPHAPPSLPRPPAYGRGQGLRSLPGPAGGWGRSWRLRSAQLLRDRLRTPGPGKGGRGVRGKCGCGGREGRGCGGTGGMVEGKGRGCAGREGLRGGVGEEWGIWGRGRKGIWGDGGVMGIEKV